MSRRWQLPGIRLGSNSLGKKSRPLYKRLLPRTDYLPERIMKGLSPILQKRKRSVGMQSRTAGSSLTKRLPGI
jgi:hypothetical protein